MTSTRLALVLAGVTGAVLAPTALPAATAAPGPAAPAAATTTARSTAATAATASKPPKVYAVVAEANGREYLRLVNPASGRVTATLASVKAPREGYFKDIDLAPDGSVYASTYDSSLPEAYRTRLRRYTTKGVQNLQPYILSVKVAPNGKTLATTALSPDGDRDGYALEALRISTLKGTKVRDLMTHKVPVWKKPSPYAGHPAVNAGGSYVAGWLPKGNLAVGTGCCDSGWSWIASSTRANQSKTIPPRHALVGTFGTRVIGYKGNSVLQVWNDDDYVAWARWGTARNYKGKIAGRAGANSFLRDDAVARRYGATPLNISPTTFPYKGNGTVKLASL